MLTSVPAEISRRSYRDQIWHYQVRQWRQDGPAMYLAIVTNGCTDHAEDAFRLLQAERRPTHIYDCYTDEIIARNY